MTCDWTSSVRISNMEAHLELLVDTPTATVLDFKCLAEAGSISDIEYNTTDEISFIRRGYYYRHSGKHEHLHDSRSVMLTSAGSEHRTSHGRDPGDECTVLNLSDMALEQALSAYWNGNLPNSTGTGRSKFPRSRLMSSVKLDYLHHQLYNGLRSHRVGNLWAETLIINVVRETLQQLSDGQPAAFSDSSPWNLDAVERGKEFIIANLEADISLTDIAKAAFVSPYHFTKIFRQYASITPYQYLINTRLTHAQHLLRDTAMNISQIGFACGFGSTSQFVNHFSNRVGISPLKFRRR